MTGVEDDVVEMRHRRYDCTGDDPVVLEQATEAARQAIADGACIVLPTDTVYGIGADAFEAAAVQRLLDAKHRGRDSPPPVLISDPSLIRALATEVPQAAKDLVAAHWPGALTLICQIQPSLRMDLGDTDGTIALRVPDHPLAREILRRTGPMAVSSANLSGQRAATTVDEAVAQLGDRVAVYLDGGPLGGEDVAPSTIVDFTRSDDGEVLRHGALSIAVLRQTCPELVDGVGEQSMPAEPVADPAVREAHGSSALRPAEGTEQAAQDAPYPTTDDLGITHPRVDPTQPDLFGGERETESPRDSSG